jgi:hypothetical protein
MRTSVRPPLPPPCVAALCAWLASGCTTGFGPRAVQGERPDYNEKIVRSTDQEILLNLVRLRYNDSVLFLDLGSVVTQYNYSASVNAGGTVTGTGTGDATFGTGLGYSEEPTLTYTPLRGEDFATRVLTPAAQLAHVLLPETAGAPSACCSWRCSA